MEVRPRRSVSYGARCQQVLCSSPVLYTNIRLVLTGECKTACVIMNSPVIAVNQWLSEQFEPSQSDKRVRTT